MLPHCRPSAGFSLLELLLVVAVVATLVAIVLPSPQPGVYDQLRCTAQIVATDLAYARSLAVANDSYYRITFDLLENRYVLRHSGPNPALVQLPNSPFSSQDNPADQHTVDLDDLPHVGPTVRLAAAATGDATMQSVDDVEFGPLGQTTAATPTTIWLAAGKGDHRKYITLKINPVTGMADIGDLTDTEPLSGAEQVF